MFDESNQEGIDVDRLLNEVGDPEELINSLRGAHRERQERRAKFIDSLSPDVKAEWIDGQPVYHSPAREAHNAAVQGLATSLQNYSNWRIELIIRVEKAMVEAGENNFEPDLCVWLASAHTFDGELVVYPRPDLAVEVLSKKTKKRDLGTKKREYARAGTSEYWVVDADQQTILQFTSENKTFVERRTYSRGEVIACHLCPDLRLPVDAIWDRSAMREFNQGLITDS